MVDEAVVECADIHKFIGMEEGLEVGVGKKCFGFSNLGWEITDLGIEGGGDPAFQAPRCVPKAVTVDALEGQN